jgi:hypothetical protein
VDHAHQVEEQAEASQHAHCHTLQPELVLHSGGITMWGGEWAGRVDHAHQVEEQAEAGEHTHCHTLQPELVLRSGDITREGVGGADGLYNEQYCRPKHLQQNPIHRPYHTVYVYQCTVFLFTQGRGRVEPERRLEGQQFTKLGGKYRNDWLYLQSINSEHLLERTFMDFIF